MCLCDLVSSVFYSCQNMNDTYLIEIVTQPTQQQQEPLLHCSKKNEERNGYIIFLSHSWQASTQLPSDLHIGSGWVKTTNSDAH